MIYPEKTEDRSVSKKDQLNYRATLQSLCNRCFENIGQRDLARCVVALKMGLYFQIPGLPFKTRIDDKIKQLNQERIERENSYKNKLGRSFYSNYNQATIFLELEEWYWMMLFEYLLDLLAEHDALLMARDYVETGEVDLE